MSVPLHPPEPTEEQSDFQDNLANKMMTTKWWYVTLVTHFGQLDTKKVEDVLKEAAMSVIPVRSGRLLDTILDTLKVELTHRTADSLYFDLTYDHAMHRPDVMRGRVKHGPVASGQREFGLGEDYIPTHSIPNVKRITTGTQIMNTNTYGNVSNTVLYELDDPQARSEIMETMTNLFIGAFVMEFEKLFDTIPAIKGIKIGKVDGIITQKEDMDKYLKGGLI